MQRQYFDFEALLTGRWITDLANTSAFIFQEIPDLNWDVDSPKLNRFGEFEKNFLASLVQAVVLRSL